MRFSSRRSTTEQIISLSSKFLRNLGSVLIRRLNMFCRPQESIRPDSLWKALWIVAWVRCWQPPVTAVKLLYSWSEVCFRVRRVKSPPFTVAAGLREGCVLSLLFFIVNTGLHNPESSKGLLININLPRAANIYFISMWRFHCSMEEILEQQLLIRGRVFATFSTIEKALAGREKSFRRPYVVQAGSTWIG